jgi:hypothetical protein
MERELRELYASMKSRSWSSEARPTSTLATLSLLRLAVIVSPPLGVFYLVLSHLG